MKKLYFLLLAVFFMSCSSLQKGQSHEKDLKAAILTDETLSIVKNRAIDLVKTGFTAGDGYAEVWIRDFNTFVTLATTVQDKNTMKENFRVFFKLQGKDGSVIDGFIPSAKASSTGINYDYIYSDLAPEFAGHKNTVETDQESSLVQAVYKYVKSSGDTDFLNERIDGISVVDRLSLSMEFLMNHRYEDSYGLLWGATTADWGDVQPEHVWGVYLDEDSHLAIDVYDNAMFLIALDNLMELQASKVHAWKKTREAIAKNVMKYLWDEKAQKFIPHLYLKDSPFPDSFDENEIFYHGGTAVIFP